jgi:hypothetical protein
MCDDRQISMRRSLDFLYLLSPLRSNVRVVTTLDDPRFMTFLPVVVLLAVGNVRLSFVLNTVIKLSFEAQQDRGAGSTIAAVGG